MKKMKIIIVIIILFIILFFGSRVIVNYSLSGWNSISKKEAIHDSRKHAENSCKIFLADHVNDYNRYILKKSYHEKRPIIEVIKKNVLFFNDSIVYIRINNDRFKFKYKIKDIERFDYDLKLIEEYIHLEDYKKYKY